MGRELGEGRITLPKEVMGLIRNEDAVNHANAQVSIHEAKIVDGQRLSDDFAWCVPKT